MPHEKAAAITSGITYSASAGSLIAGLSANELAAYVGIAVAVLSWLTGSVINVFFKWQHLKIARSAAEQKGIDLDESE